MKIKGILYLTICLAVMASFISCNKEGEVNRTDDNSDSGEVNFQVDIGDSKIPYLIVTTDVEILNEPKISGNLDVYISKKLTIQQLIGIEYRGSTSFRSTDKYSFGIETWDENGADIDASFFGFPEEEDWILQGHVINSNEAWDKTLMNHFIAYELFRDMGNYASRCEFVELELNGQYEGIYVFMEKLKRDKNRIAIESLKPDDTDISGGYIIKIDKTAGGDLGLSESFNYYKNNWSDDARYSAGLSFRSDYTVLGDLIDFPAFGEPYHDKQYLETYFLYEYPKKDVITEGQKTYIQGYIRDFETALLGDDFSTTDRTYTDYIDLDSFVEFFIINELCRNGDGYRLSTFLHKDRGGKLVVGPPWDFNIGFNYESRIPIDDWVVNFNDYNLGDAWSMPFWWPRLLEDPVFTSAVKTRWLALRADVLSNQSVLGSVTSTAQYLRENGAIERNYDRWNGDLLGINYEVETNALKTYLTNRMEWMDSEIGAF